MRTTLKIVSALAFFLSSTLAHAQGGPKATSSSSPYRSFAVGLPLVAFDGEASGRLEFNVMAQGSLALEITGQRSAEQVSDKDKLETNESLVSGGRGLSLVAARYTQPTSMSGFYWALGAGVREENATWQVQPSDKDKATTSITTDNRGLLNHQANLKGATAHGRIGYRYSGTSYPFMIGGFLGARHFEAAIKDADVEENTDTAITAMSSFEKEKLRRRAATSMESSIEVGVMF